MVANQLILISTFMSDFTHILTYFVRQQFQPGSHHKTEGVCVCMYMYIYIYFFFFCFLLNKPKTDQQQRVLKIYISLTNCHSENNFEVRCILA